MPMHDADDKTMDDDALCALIDRQSRQAIGADDLTEVQRAEAMEFYLGEARGELAPPESEGRSRVVSKDLMDTVEWAMPALMDIFASADDIIRFEPDGQEDEQACQDATNYVGWLIHRKNEDGFITIHDAIKSALITRTGFGKCYVDAGQDYREEHYGPLTEAEVRALDEDPEIEIIELQEAGFVPVPVPPVPVPPGALPQHSVQGGLAPPVPPLLPTFVVRARRAQQVLQFKNEGVPPEEMRIARDTRTLSECRFIEHRREVTLSYLREQGYDEDQIEALASDLGHASGSGDGGSQAARDARHRYDDTDPTGDEAADDSQRLVWLSESYLKVDFDGDGRTEYRRVVKVGSTVFENTVVDEHPFWLMAPILMPYKVVGLSMWDLVEDLQRIKTALQRQVLDNVYLANNPMKEVVEDAVVDMDELLAPRVGGIYRVRTPNAVREVATPFLGAPALELLARVDQIRDTRSGVTEMNSATNVEALAQSSVGSQGVQALMNQGAQRLRLIARVLAETGFKRMYWLMLKNITQHQDRPQQVKINGRWLHIDPREWKNRYNMTVSVGVGTFGRQQQVVNLTALAGMQQQAMGLGLANANTLYNTLKRTAEAMGYRDADQFFTAPQLGPDGKPMPPPQQPAPPQPGQAEAQAMVQAEQIKAQALLQKADMDNQARLVIEREKIQSEERVAMFKARAQLEQQQQQAALKAAAAQGGGMPIHPYPPQAQAPA